MTVDSGPGGNPRFGAFLFTSHFQGLTEADVFSAALRYATLAERTGFDDLWVDEHHFISYGINPSALTFASFLLGRTSRLRVGTAVVLLPHASPVFVAEQAALLDHLSGGRLDLGIGRGGPTVDLPVAGRGFADWADGYWPSVDLLLEAWGGKARADGGRFSFPEVTVRPTPRAGRPSLLTASTSDASVEQAARRGIPLMLFLQESDESRRAKTDRWAEVAAAHGHPTARPGHAFAVIAHATEPGEADDAIADRLLDFFVRSNAEYTFLPEAIGNPSAKAPHTPEEMRSVMDHILATHPVGGPEQCAARLTESMRTSGADRVLLMLEGAGEPDRVARNVETFGREILPRVRAALA